MTPHPKPSPKVPRPRKAVKRKSRSPSEYARIYGSKERVLWVKAQRCIAATTMCWGDVDNHHTENGGLSRKADYQTIVPLCEWHHVMLHDEGKQNFEAIYGLDLETEAAATEAAWQKFINQESPE